MLVEAEDGFDPERDFTRAVAMHPVVKAGDDTMHAGNGLLERVAGNETGLNWFRLEPIFQWSAPTADEGQIHAAE